MESQLSDYAAQDQKLQMELSLNGFPRYVGPCICQAFYYNACNSQHSIEHNVLTEFSHKKLGTCLALLDNNIRCSV